MCVASDWVRKHVHGWHVILSFIFALLFTLGFWTDRYDSMEYMGERPACVALSALIAFLISTFAVAALSSEFTSSSHGGGSNGLGWHPLAYAGIAIACWVPILVVCFPATAGADLFGELPMFFGLQPMTSHHPPLVIALYGIVFKVGSLLGGANGGMFALTLSQVAFMGAAIAATMWLVDRLARRRWLTVLSLCFFSLMPIFPTYAQFIVKDVYSTCAIDLFCVQLVARSWKRGGGESIPWALGFPAIGVMGVLASLLRNNNVFIVVVALAAYALAAPSRRPDHLRGGKVEGRGEELRPAMLCALTVFILCFLVNNALYPAMGIAKGELGEALSLPMQQTARFARDHPDEVTPEQSAVLTQTFFGYDTLGQVYDESISDPVKDRFRFTGYRNLIAYMRVWVQQGLAEPGTYAVSAIEGSIGYWYPFGVRAQANDDYADMAMVGGASSDSTMWADLGLSPTSAPFPEARVSLHDAVWSLSQTPVVSLLFHPATYLWVMLLCCAQALSVAGKVGDERLAWLRPAAWSLLMAAILLTLTCCASPVSALVRYALPPWFWAPLALALPFAERLETSSR